VRAARADLTLVPMGDASPGWRLSADVRP
jgi:hypothetical protein